MKKPVNVTLDEDLWERFRIQAIREKTSGSAILERLMAGYLGESPYPPTSRAPVESKRAHAKAAKASSRQTRKTV
jgi:hypothetical protein